MFIKDIGGLCINKRKKIKLNGTYYTVKVDTYANHRIRIQLVGKSNTKDLTIDLQDEYLENGKVFLDPFIKKNSALKDLRKTRIIREICGVLNYNYVDIPIAVLNMGILRKYDNTGVTNHLSKINQYGDYYE